MWIIRSVGTDLKKWTEAAINVDTYSFSLSQTWAVTLKIQELVFSSCIVSPDSKETEFGINDEVESVPLKLFLVVWIFPRSLCVICYVK